MPCPVTSGFFHSLEHSSNDKTRSASFDFVADVHGSYPDLKRAAALELEQPVTVYARRAQCAIEATIELMLSRAPTPVAPLVSALPQGPDRVLAEVVKLKEDLRDLIFVGEMKKKAYQAENLRKLADRIAIEGGAIALEKQLTAFILNDFRGVGYGLGDAFRAMHVSSDVALRTGRGLLRVKDG